MKKLFACILMSAVTVSAYAGNGHRHKDLGKFLFGFAIGAAVMSSAKTKEQHLIYEKYPTSTPLEFCPIIKRVIDYRGDKVKQYVVRDCSREIR